MGLGKQGRIIDRVGLKIVERRLGQKPGRIEGSEQVAGLFQPAQAIEADSIEPLENVAIFAMLRRAIMLFVEADDILEAGDDPLLARGVGSGLRRLDCDAQFGQQFVVRQISHWQPPASGSGRTRRRLRQAASPTHRAR